MGSGLYPREQKFVRRFVPVSIALFFVGVSFMYFIVLPIVLLFARFWHKHYYALATRIVQGDEGGSAATVRYIDKKTVPTLSRFWHVVYFSASVLLGLRFKKQWMQVGGRTKAEARRFITWVTIEWASGIGLYIVFALLAKGHRLSYIKGLLGF